MLAIKLTRRRGLLLDPLLKIKSHKKYLLMLIRLKSPTKSSSLPHTGSLAAVVVRSCSRSAEEAGGCSPAPWLQPGPTSPAGSRPAPRTPGSTPAEGVGRSEEAPD